MIPVASAFGAQAVDASVRVTYVVRPDARSGRLVRAAARQAADPAPQIQLPGPAVDRVVGSLRQVMDRIAQRHSVDIDLVDSVIRVESNYNPFAVSPKGAQGLMQLDPATARRFGAGNAFNPTQNVEAGIRYLRYLLDTYHGDHRLALAAYNAGEGAVGRWRGVPPYPETRRYVYEVGKKFGDAKAARRSETAAAVAPAKTSDGYNPILSFVDAAGKIFYRTP